MPRRQAINDPSIRYKRYLVEFMTWFHERPASYPQDQDFEQDVLLTVKPKDITRWMCVKAFGMPQPTVNDNPTLGRSSSLAFYKKALSYFMPNKLMTWNEVAQVGNPSKSQEVNNLLKRVKKCEVRKTGKASSARRPLVHGEFQNCLSILQRPENDYARRYLIPCTMKMQYNMVARLDDVCELEYEDIQPSDDFNFALTCKMCWSKNVHEERDAPEQILLGAMDTRYCILLALAIYLEAWIGTGQGMVGTLLFNASDDNPTRVKALISEILRSEAFNSPDFVRMKDGPVGTHSIRKLPASHARKSDCSKDNVDVRARWKRKARQQDGYVEVTLPYPDAKVAAKLCIGGCIKYQLRQNSGITDEWIAEFVVPNILRRFPQGVGRVLGRALLWACFEPNLAGYVPQEILDRVRNAYTAIRVLPEGENPVVKLELVVTGNEDQLHIDELGHFDEDNNENDAGGGAGAGGAGGAGGAINNNQNRRRGGTRDEVMAVYSQVTGLRREIEALRLSNTHNQQRNEQNFRGLNRKLNRIALQPVQRVINNNNNEEGVEGGNAPPDGAAVPYVSSLSPTPRTLYVLWQEYEYGVGGRKAARLFTTVERGKVKYTYHRRKVVWDVIAMRIRAGDTSQIAVDTIYEVYGVNSTVSRIINQMRADRRLYMPIGCHPRLQA
jgi:hypothetical protein